MAKSRKDSSDSQVYACYVILLNTPPKYMRNGGFRSTHTPFEEVLDLQALNLS